MQSSSFEFANTTTNMAANSLKFYVSVSNWPFRNIQNELNLEFDSKDDNNEQCNIETQTDASSSIQSFVINYGEYALYHHRILSLIVYYYNFDIE